VHRVRSTVGWVYMAQDTSKKPAFGLCSVLLQFDAVIAGMVNAYLKSM
jgi:hypothetical protein